MSEIYRIIAEQFEFKGQFYMDQSGHPQTSMTPRSVITLRGRRAITCFLLLYESCLSALAYRGAAGEAGERTPTANQQKSMKRVGASGVTLAAPTPQAAGAGSAPRRRFYLILMLLKLKP